MEDQRETAAMRFAYADPPYLGCCGLYDHFHGDDGLCWDEPTTHKLLIGRLCDEYPDGWALSASMPSLHELLPMVPRDSRISPWCKSFSAFKKGVRPAYAWEPVLWRGGRNPNHGHPHAPPERGGKQNTPKDFLWHDRHDIWNGRDGVEALLAPITLKKGLTGAKPESFCAWVLDLLNVQIGDSVDDLFPGTGVMGRVAASVVSGRDAAR